MHLLQATSVIINSIDLEVHVVIVIVEVQVPHVATMNSTRFQVKLHT